MTKNAIILLIVVIVFIFLSVKAIFFPSLLFIFPCAKYDKTPRWFEGITALVAVCTYVLGAVLLMIRERKIIGNEAKFVKGHHWFWPFPKLLIARYKSIKGVIFLYSLMMTSILFSAAIPLTSRLVHWRIPSGTSSGSTPLPEVDSTRDNPINFLYSQGAIVSFVVVCLGIFTFTNTLILRSKHEREIESLEELLYILQERLSKENDKEYWNTFSHKFFYVLDHTIACGHFSAGEEFKNYAISLRHFLKRHDVNFRGLIYTFNRSNEYLIKLECGSRSPTEEEKNSIKAKLLSAHDEFISYLNSEIRNDDGSFDRIKGEKIKYRPYRVVGHRLTNAFFRSVLGELVLSEPNAARGQDDDPTLPANDYEESRAVLQTEEIGLTRFIVCNLFIVQFIATARDQKNVPSGYISEDLLIIERYKRTYEQYRRTHFM